MLLAILLAAGLLVSTAASALAVEQRHPGDGHASHPNHIFNAIHSSMRQWGSSLQHNGMSFFIATVPAHTHFYHGTYSATPVTGIEWLAFEPDHALFFARSPPPGKGPPSDSPGRSPPAFPPPSMQQRAEQHPFQDPHAPPSSPKHVRGYLHTYAAKHDLRLLYIDGMSAGKSRKGTMDTQDYLVAPNSSTVGIGGEYERAAEMCRRAEEQWAGAIDGILRMEAGFEVILCSFAAHVVPLRIAAVPPTVSVRREAFFSYYQSVTARYDGIGGGRVRLDYDDFVTAFAYPRAHLFQSGPLPRLNATDKDVLRLIAADVDRLAALPRGESHGHDWQGVVDMLVARHSTRLRYLAIPDGVSSPSELAVELGVILRPFIDYDARNASVERARCTDEFIPAHWPCGQACRAIREVSSRICSTLFTLLDAGQAQDLAMARAKVHSLLDWLDWTDGKRCMGCTVAEVCLVPIWPHGSLTDWLHPSCVNASDLPKHSGYWW